MKGKSVLAVFALLGLAAGIAVLAMTLGPFAPVKVRLAEAKAARLEVSVFGIGTVDARYAYVLGPTQTGRLWAVLADHGDHVKSGQVLAELDPVDLTDRLASTEAGLARANHTARAAQAQAREAQSRLRTAQANAERYRELFAKGFVSRELADNRANEADAARAALEAARAQSEAARDDLERLARERDGVAKQLDNLKLRSPVDGIVVERAAEPGSTVVAGQAVLKVIDPSSVWVRARIDQARAGGVRPGQEAEIVLRSHRQRPLAGKVARVELQSDVVTEERIVNVAFEAPPPDVSIGELAEVTIHSGRIDDALVIPGSALRRLGEQTGVWRVERGRARFHPVTPGAQSLDGELQLLAGLRRGDEVVVYTSALLSEGARVRVQAPQ